MLSIYNNLTMWINMERSAHTKITRYRGEDDDLRRLKKKVTLKKGATKEQQNCKHKTEVQQPQTKKCRSLSATHLKIIENYQFAHVNIILKQCYLICCHLEVLFICDTHTKWTTLLQHKMAT